MKILFICNQNQHRSPTAAELFKTKFETKSAGLYSVKPVSEQELDWANIVIVMEEDQRTELSKRFPKQYMQKQIVSLDVPDVYSYNQPELRELLTTKINNILASHQIVS